MKIKQFVSNNTKQTIINGFNIEPDGQKEAQYALKGTVKDINKAVKKIRENGNPNFVSFAEPQIETIVSVVPIDIFNAIAINENDAKEMDKLTYANQAIINIQNWITENSPKASAE